MRDLAGLGPQDRVEQRLERDAVDECDEAFGLLRGVRLRPARGHELDHGAAEVEVGGALDGGQFGIGAGLAGEGEGHDPVTGRLRAGREGVGQHRSQRVLGREVRTVGVARPAAVQRRLQREREQLALLAK